MIRTVLLTAFAVSIAILGGAGSVWYALSAQRGIGAVSIGAWTAYPDLGGPQADPYSRARVARDGVLTLGRAEGVAFVASEDSSGERLRGECAYTVVGSLPPARLWTLHAADGEMRPLKPALPHETEIHAQSALRLPGGGVSVAVGAKPQPGNWIATSGTGPMTIVLTLYDTPLLGGTGLADAVLPQVIRGACDA